MKRHDPADLDSSWSAQVWQNFLPNEGQVILPDVKAVPEVEDEMGDSKRQILGDALDEVSGIANNCGPIKVLDARVRLT